MSSSCRRAPETGDTLVEIIIALTLAALTVVTIISAIASAVSLSVVHRGQTDVSATLVSAAEFLKSEPYAPCCGTAGCTGVAGETRLIPKPPSPPTSSPSR
jgi:hypothetical protein